MKKKSSSTKATYAKGPIVGIIMGSDSDWPVMEQAHEILKEAGVPHEVRVISAHRTPKQMLAYAEAAQARGLKVIIAGAGGAAHLPGMIASATALPVIGVPVAITKIDGIDALLSTVQMPLGVPVATVGIDNSGNAALLALRWLAQLDSKLGELAAKALKSRMRQGEKRVAAAGRRLKRLTR